MAALPSSGCWRTVWPSGTIEKKSEKGGRDRASRPPFYPVDKLLILPPVYTEYLAYLWPRCYTKKTDAVRVHPISGILWRRGEEAPFSAHRAAVTAARNESEESVRDSGRYPFPARSSLHASGTASASLSGAAAVPGGQCLKDRGAPGLQPGGGGAHRGYPPLLRYGAGPPGLRRRPPVLCPQGPHRSAGAFFDPPSAGRPLRLS